MKAHRETYNDGFLQYGQNETQRSLKGKRIGNGFQVEGKLAFKVLSCRESDYQMAGILGASLDLKVKTPFPPSFQRMNKNKLKVAIDGTEYDVIKVDHDSNRTNLYFYLQAVGESNE